MVHANGKVSALIHFMSVVGIEIEPRGAAAPDQVLNSLGAPLASRAMAGLGQGSLTRQTATPSALANFRSSWQSQLASLGTDADSSLDSVIGDEETSPLSASTPSSTPGDQTLSVVAGRLGRSAFEDLVESNAKSDVWRASERTTVSNPQTALMAKNREGRTQALSATAGLQSQPGRSIVSDSVRTSLARKSTEGDLNSSPGGDAIPTQSSLIIPSPMVATLDTPNQGQPSLQTSNGATPQEPLESVRGEYLAIGTQSPASGPSLTNPSILPSHRELEIQAGPESPPLPITRGSSLTTDQVETPAVAPERAALRDPAAVPAYKRGPAEPSMFGSEPADRASTQTLISPQNEGTVSDPPESASLYQTGSLASLGLEASVAAPGARGSAFSRQATAVHAQTKGSAGAAIDGSTQPDQAGLIQSAADPKGLGDRNPFSNGPKISVGPQSMPPTGYMRSNQGMQATSTTPGDGSAVPMQSSGPANQLSSEPRSGAFNDSQSVSEPQVMKPGAGKTGKLQFQTEQGGASGVLASAAPAAHPASFTASIPGSDAFSLARDPSSVQAANGTAAGVGESSSAAQGTSTTHQTFATLDNIDDRTALNWVHAGARHAEAGFEDPTLGWIGVRADQSGGGVHAIVVPPTAEAAQALGSQMAGLNAHLAESHTPLASLSLGPAEGREGGAGAGQSFNQSAGQDQAQSNSQDPYVSPTQVIGTVSSVASAVVSTPTTSPGLPDHEAKHISVMA